LKKQDLKPAQIYHNRMTAEEWIEKLGLAPHPEGGYFKEMYRCARTIDSAKEEESRSLSTSIYFLLKGHDVSHFHRLSSDEIWFYHAGDSLTLYTIAPDGSGQQLVLGSDAMQHEQLQLLIPAEHLFGGFCNNADGYTMVSCVVSPGFDFRDFEMPSHEQLMHEYPEHSEWIARLSI
jgi:predicted cupin superfamily sugar epimerase